MLNTYIVHCLLLFVHSALLMCFCAPAVLGGVFFLLFLVFLSQPSSFIPLESLQCPCWTSQGLVSFSCLVSLLCLQIRSPFTPCSFSQASAALQSVLVSMASFHRGLSQPDRDCR